MKKPLNIIIVSLLAMASSQLALAQDSVSSDAQTAEQMNALQDQIQQLEQQLEQLTAAEPAVSEAAAAPAAVPAAKLWSGEIAIGYANQSGNTEETTYSGKFDIEREKDQWRYKILLDSLNSKASGERSSERYFLSNRLAYQFSDTNYAFGYAAYDDDRFSGFDYQATLSAGYGRRLLNNEKMQWDVEVGPGYRESKTEATGTTESDTSEELIVRMYTNYSWNFTDTANFSQTLEVEAGSDNTISRSVSSLSTQVIGALALKLSYAIKYTEEVPTDRKHADQETVLSLAYTF